MFILFSAMLTATQYFGIILFKYTCFKETDQNLKGNPIDCMVQGVPNSIVNTYCWTHGTYTIKDLEHFTVNILILLHFWIKIFYFHREESRLQRRESTCGSMITQG